MREKAGWRSHRHRHRHLGVAKVVVGIALLALLCHVPVCIVAFSPAVRRSSVGRMSISVGVSSSSSSSSNSVEDAKAYRQQSPHSERHFIPTHPAYSKERSRFWWSGKKNRNSKVRRNRFFEGWYYRVTLPDTGDSFAFIFSIEDPTPHTTPHQLATVQIMGPNDGDYLVECTKDHTRFWAHQHCQGFGCVFHYSSNYNSNSKSITTAIPTDQFFQQVNSGFQMLPTRLQGVLNNAHDGSKGGVLPGQGKPALSPTTFDLAITPLSGWGDDPHAHDHAGAGAKQKSTAGWLASHAVFEPHWQVTLADARVNGTIHFNNQTYHLNDAPFYAEKNWGGGFPIKWHWLQCNSFHNYTRLSVTAVGAIRKLPLKTQETVGLLCIHHNGTFYEAVPWTGQVSWTVDPWGKWYYLGRCTSGNRLFEAELNFTCPTKGTVLRAPTPDGMILACKDAFQGQGTLNLWSLQYDPSTQTYQRSSLIIDHATTTQAAVEVGGGPWWDTWTATTKMKQPFKSLVKLPYVVDNLRQKITTSRKNKQS